MNHPKSSLTRARPHLLLSERVFYCATEPELLLIASQSTLTHFSIINVFDGAFICLASLDYLSALSPNTIIVGGYTFANFIEILYDDPDVWSD